MGPLLTAFKSVIANLRDNEYFQSINDKAGRTDCVVVNIPIGTAIPAMSREELVWDKEATINALTTSLDDMLIKMLQETQQNMDFNRMFRPGANRGEASNAYGHLKTLAKSTENPQLKEAINIWYKTEKKQAKEKQILIDAGFAIHPGFLHHVTNDWGFHRNSSRGQDSIVEMSMGAVMPLNQLSRDRYHGYDDADTEELMSLTCREWDHATNVTIMTPSPTAEDLHNFYTHNTHDHFGHMGRGRMLRPTTKQPKLKYKSTPIYPTDDTVSYWFNTIMEVNNEQSKLANKNKISHRGYGYGHEVPIIIFAEDEAKVKVLLELAAKEGKHVALLDIEKRHVELVGQAPLEELKQNQVWTTSTWNNTTQTWIEHKGDAPAYWCSENPDSQAVKLLKTLAEEQGFELHLVTRNALTEFAPEFRAHNISLQLDTKLHELIAGNKRTLPESKEKFYMQLTEPKLNYANWAALLYTLGRLQDHYGYYQGDRGSFRKEFDVYMREIDALPSVPIPEYPLLSYILYDKHELQGTKFSESIQKYMDTVNAKLNAQIASMPSP